MAAMRRPWPYLAGVIAVLFVLNLATGGRSCTSQQGGSGCSLTSGAVVGAR